MHSLQDSYQVIIVGGGPVGLFMGCCLQQKGISCLILEKRKEIVPHSRSFGIHPVSLELFERLGLARCFTERGIKIKRGIARTADKVLGSISFDRCPPPYTFVLSLPQHQTERILQQKLSGLNPKVLMRETEFLSYNETNDSVSVNFNHNGQACSVRADFLVGCDGIHSPVRRRAGILFEGSTYPDTYIMGDFDDNTDFDTDAVIFLTPDGLVESFPISGHKRRWVIKTEQYISTVTRADIEQHLLRRIGHDISTEPCSMLSSFGVQKLIADSFVRGRVALAGDAAHVVSPIGGQGMNLGWIGAWQLAHTLERIYADNQTDWRLLLQNYSRQQKKAARRVARRAELNTRLGRETQFAPLRNAFVWLMLNTPIQQLMAEIFTMRRLNV